MDLRSNPIVFLVHGCTSLLFHCLVVIIAVELFLDVGLLEEGGAVLDEFVEVFAAVVEGAYIEIIF